MRIFDKHCSSILLTLGAVFTKLASQLTAETLVDLAVIPVIFAIQTLVSYLSSVLMTRLFKFKKRPSNFVIAMGVFGNSNSLPISLVISLSKTLKGLHWDQIPGDNDDEVAARGILYLLIFQQLGQLLRWSWGYHVLLAPPEKFEEEDVHTSSRIEEGEGRYRDDPDEDEDEVEGNPLIAYHEDNSKLNSGRSKIGLSSVDKLGEGSGNEGHGSRTESEFASGAETPITRQEYTSSVASKASSDNQQKNPGPAPDLLPTPANGNVLPRGETNGHITSFPKVSSNYSGEEPNFPEGWKGYLARLKYAFSNFVLATMTKISSLSTTAFQKLPTPVQNVLQRGSSAAIRFLRGLWEFMNPPLWAMLTAIVVASIPSLQRLFFTPGTFINNSVTRAVQQSGGVAIPLILVVLGANLARNTLPNDPHQVVDEKENRNLLIASLISRMLLPTIIMAPLLALSAKYVPVSIVDDPIFVIVCFLLTGAPSALQLAQICQINGVYEAAMSKLLFQSYVIWYAIEPFCLCEMS